MVDWKVIFLGMLGLVGLYLVGTTLISPLRFFLRVAVIFVAGGILLSLVNLVGGMVHFHIAVNPVTMLAVGAFPVPGLVFLGLMTVFVG